MNKLVRFTALAAAVAFLGACDETTGPGADGPAAPLSLSLMVPGSGGAAPAAQLFAGEIVIDDGTHTLVIQSAEVVLREIEFERVEELGGCDSDEGEVEGTDNDSCEEFETGPVLMPIPLDGSVSEQLEVAIPVGMYDEMEYDIHKLGDDPEDLAFLNVNPAFDDISLRMTYTWDGGAVQTFTNDIDVEVEIDFPTPLNIEEGATYNVTLAVDVESWFYDGLTLIDPSTALKGGENEELVEDRVEMSFEGFEDDDHDGVPHDEDDDEGAGS